MTKLKRLAVCFALMCVVTVSSFAQEPPKPPCVPGEVNTPPCALSAPDNSVLGEAQDPSLSNAADLIYSAEATIWSVLLF